ncbi:MAG: hypothetical protein AAFX87_29965 [Bacteroidota bacterium]
MKLWKIVVYSLVNAAILVFLSLLLQQQPYLYKDEELVIQFTKVLKKMTLKLEDKPPSERFLFVNTSFDNQLIDKMDETGFFPMGNQVITDRSKLAQFFHLLARNPNHEYLICDIFFKDVSPHDSLLADVISQLPRTILPYHLNEANQRVLPIFKAKTGYATIETLDDIFLKYDLTKYDSLKSVPLVMFEELHDTSIKPGRFVSKMEDQYVLDYFILDFRIRNYDLVENQTYPLVNLGELLFLGEEAVNELTKDRIIVIGDFLFNDSVETLTGEMAGPLVLLNAFLALEAHDNHLQLGFVVFLIISFFLVSVLVFHPSDIIERLINKLSKKKWTRRSFIGLSYFTILILISITAYFAFQKHINIFFLTFYLFGLDMGVQYIGRRKAKRQAQSSVEPVSQTLSSRTQ